MTNSRREIIEHWVADFCSSTAFLDGPAAVRELAPQVLVAFLQAACVARGVDPADLEEADMKPGLVDGVAPLALPAAAREGVCALCDSFLAAMEAEGRLSGGRALGRYVRALREPYLTAASPTSAPIVNRAKKLGRNDPCPCGSGRKYKKCCQNALD